MLRELQDEPKPMKKLGYLEAIRGLAALIVVFTHFAAVFYPSAVFGNAYQAHSHWERYFTTTPLSFFFSGHFAVCLFFGSSRLLMGGDKM